MVSSIHPLMVWSDRKHKRTEIDKKTPQRVRPVCQSRPHHPGCSPFPAKTRGRENDPRLGYMVIGGGRTYRRKHEPGGIQGQTSHRQCHRFSMAPAGVVSEKGNHRKSERLPGRRPCGRDQIQDWPHLIRSYSAPWAGKKGAALYEPRLLISENGK